MGLDLKIKGVLMVMFGIMATVFGWYIFGALASVIPIASLKSIYWIGAILYWISAIIIAPIIMIWGGKGDFKGSLYGLVSFFTGYLITILLYYTVGYVLDALNSIYPNSAFLGIGWGAIFLIAVIGMIILPTGLTLKDSILN